MRRHPRFVRTAVLHATMDMASKTPLGFAESAQTALDGLFEACRNEPSCRTAFPQLAASFQAVLHAIDQKPVPISLRKKDGTWVKERLNRAAFVQTIRYMQYVSASALEIPLAISRAAKGDFSILARSATLMGTALSSGLDGLYLSVTCAEDVPFISEAEIKPEVKKTYLRDYRIRQQQAACAHWPRGRIDPNFRAPLKSDIPTFLIVGALDPVTPPAWTVKTARLLSNSAFMIVPYGGHDHTGLEGTQCIQTLEETFIATAEPKKLDIKGCKAQIRRPPFPTAPPPKAITLSEKQLSRYVGAYAAREPPIQLEVVLKNGHLMTTGLGLGAMRLEPLSATEFRFADAPPGFGVSFSLKAQRAKTMTIKRPGEAPLVLNATPR